MPTQEERLSTLEQFVDRYGKDINDLNHNVTILLGVTAEQGRDIKALKVGLGALSERFGAFEQKVDGRFVALESHIGAFEQSVNSRFEAVDKRFEAFEQSVDKRFEAVDSRFDTVDRRFDEQDKKLDQILSLLHSVIPGSEQGK